MTRGTWVLLGLVLGALLIGGTANADMELRLEAGETVKSKLEISESQLEAFVEVDGAVYLRSYEKSDGIWVLKHEKSVEIHEKGLKEPEKREKSSGLDSIVKNYLDSNDYDLEELPERVDYSDSDYIPPAEEQSGNSCVGWAVGYYLRTFQEGKEQGWNIMGEGKINSERVFSPYFIYNQINGGADNGSTLQDAGKLLKNVGAVTISDFSDPEGFEVKPSYDIVRKGYKYRIKDYYNLFGRNDSAEIKVSRLKEYLLTGDLPVVGVDAGYSWEQPHMDENGNYIVVSDESYIGGHAVIVVGYDDKLPTPDGIGAFEILNSWGAEWGNGGYSYVSYEAMAEDTISGVVYTDLERFYVENEHAPYVSGYVDGTFKPDRFITRAETVKLIVSSSGEELQSGEQFSDVGESHWAGDEIYTAFQKGYISGYPDGSFRPDVPVTRAEFAAIIYGSMGQSIPKGGDYFITRYFYDSLDMWSTRRVNILGTMGLINGYPDGSFRPDEYVSRAEAVVILNRVKERIADRDFMDRTGKAQYRDVATKNSKHWAYYDILEASLEHVFLYELDDRRELKEIWRSVD